MTTDLKAAKDREHNILLVDDAEEIRLLITHQLRKAGYAKVIEAASAAEAFSILGLDRDGNSDSKSKMISRRRGRGDAGVLFIRRGADDDANEDSALILNWNKTVAGIDLIIMDIVMPEIDGIEACRRIKKDDRFEDVPIIMITALADKGILQSAFDAGAMDYIAKPVDKLELIARVRSSLRLKDEMENRRERERELIVMSRKLAAANQVLQRLSMLDGLTGIPNRRRFDEVLAYEWKQAMRSKQPLSLVMIDIDHFKAFNDHYGHLTGDDCLKQVALAMSSILKRPTDILARYGGEEFVAILPFTASDGATAIATAMRTCVEDLAVPHDYSSAASRVTISMGIATLVPRRGMTAAMLISAADQALYEAKAGGRNRIVVNRFSPS
ncbi:MAG: diguanylate cyclase [Deltaproteobacteria bacterium]|nr:diguanylate cyclase [Deltaproteobacteria bacterium]